MPAETTTAVRLPAEWEPHEWVWIGFPHDAGEWPDALDEARRDVAAFADAVQGAGEQVRLVVRDEDNAEIAAGLVGGHVDIRIHAFGDIWLRDTGPLIVKAGDGRTARLFDFNGWGGKFEMAGDREIGAALAGEAELEAKRARWVCEGGSLDFDGSGLVVTTEQCLLNRNRNADMSRRMIEEHLADDLGLDRVLWLGDGLANDHTDGHVDNLARFVGANRLAVPVSEGSDDPNADIYADARRRAREFGVEVVDIPSPGRVEEDGEVIPASYMNFYISNGAVIVPVYDRPNDKRAVDAIGSLFPDRAAIGVPANGIIRGGGSFHCCSQQMPL